MKAIGLLSGGLDSRLAVKAVLAQGVEVEAVNFGSVFWTPKVKGVYKPKGEEFARELGIPFRFINIDLEILEVVRKPKYGYGSGVNPCIDCHILMFKKAGEYMREVGGSFIVTGEVLGERPMSQGLRSLKLIEKESGLEGLILRPLSAKLLEPTIPEREGWVDRERLFGIKGRSRKPQMELAGRYGLKDYPTPAGGCLLTDPQFAKRMKDLLDHNEVTVNQVELLKIGRHFRLSEKTKLIVGRNKEENLAILDLAQEGNWLFDARGIPGPLGLLRGTLSPELKEVAAAITARYSDAKKTEFIALKVYEYGAREERELLKVRPLEDEMVEIYRI